MQDELENQDDDEPEEAGSYSKASAEVMAQRKIIKVKRLFLFKNHLNHYNYFIYIEKAKIALLQYLAQTLSQTFRE